ncbi:MAG: hydroxyacylglutathione hydrolase [Pseudomonadota bacterium]
MNLDNSENHAHQQIAASFVAALPSKLHRIKAFQDNYLWMLQDPASRLCWVVDPGDAQAIIETVVSQALELTGILLTHHHADHQGGVEELLVWAARRGIALKIYGPRDERIHAAAQGVGGADYLDLGFTSARVIEVPGRGDCLFAAGCGRIFEGNPRQMLDSLARLCELPEDSLICCAHEYTLSNLRFAKAAYPSHEAIEARLLEAETLRAQDLPTVPSLLKHELISNPFLLGLVPGSPLHDESACLLTDSAGKRLPVQKLTGDLHSADAKLERFAALRAWKNEFRA